MLKIRGRPWLVGFTAVSLCLWRCEVAAECERNTTDTLRAHVVPDAFKYFTGNFTDVWASTHVTEMLNSSYTEIRDGGDIKNYVLYKDGRGFSASGRLWADECGILHIKVEGFDVPGLIFPLFASPQVIGYYTCYPKVGGSGVSVITARRSSLLLPDTLNHILEAKMVFRNLEEQGVPINDGADYDHC